MKPEKSRKSKRIPEFRTRLTIVPVWEIPLCWILLELRVAASIPATFCSYIFGMGASTCVTLLDALRRSSSCTFWFAQNVASFGRCSLHGTFHLNSKGEVGEHHKIRLHVYYRRHTHRRDRRSSSLKHFVPMLILQYDLGRVGIWSAYPDLLLLAPPTCLEMSNSLSHFLHSCEISEILLFSDNSGEPLKRWKICCIHLFLMIF